MPILLHLVVFCASCLLFQVELLSAKAMLPGFGGSYLVWSLSIMLFQGLLLLGYLYAHAVGRLGGQRWVRGLVLLVPLLPLALFPIAPEALTTRRPGLPFALDIVWTLSAAVGAAFFVLSSFSVLAQRLLAGTGGRPGANPYVLYASSNLGSFVGLLSYPLLVEPHLDLEQQLLLWQVCYAGTALLFVLLQLRAGQGVVTAAATLWPRDAEARQRRAVWLLLSCAGAALFLAVTNGISVDLAAVPLIWVAPLAVYLFSFVLVFRERPWYPRWLKERFALLAAVGLLLFCLHLQSYSLPLPLHLGVHLTVLFGVCVICHGELYRSRPVALQELAAFYIFLSLGGFLGGLLVSWIIPLLSNAVVEYAAGFALLAAGLALQRREPLDRRSLPGPLLAGALLVLWSMFAGAREGSVSSTLAAAAGALLALLFYAMRRRYWSLALSLALALVLAQHLERLRPGQTLLEKKRNFYGIYTIYDQAGKRHLKHGTTLHGTQYLDPARSREALTYYHRRGPAGELLAAGVLPQQRMAVVGLGAGSLATYVQPGQEMVFYELDPYNLEVAQRHFNFLAQAEGRVTVVPGDARLSLEQDPQARFDLLLVDAFNSDSIPMHLVTVEAMALYLERVGPQGLVLMHISNRILDLRPVLLANARELGATILVKHTARSPDGDSEASEWAALTREGAIAAFLTSRFGWERMADLPLKRVPPWTDRFSNILDAFK